jgi:hypothetical protein
VAAIVPPVQPPPVRAASLDASGRPTKIWVQWFHQLLTTSQAVAANTTDISGITVEVTTVNATLATQAAELLAAAMVAAMADPPRDWTREFDELRARHASLDVARDWMREFDELRAWMASLDTPRDYRSEIDELRAWLASLDVPQLTNLTALFDPLGAAAAAVAALLAGSNTWNGALQTINGNVKLWGELLLTAAGMDWSAATIYGTGLFTGDMHFPYSNGFWYASPNATGWFEFRVITSQGAALANDFLGWQYNTRSTVGGADLFLTAFQLNALTGLLTIYTAALFSATATFTVAPVFSDQPNSRLALGLGSAATQASSAFDASGAAAAVLATSLQKANNLSDVASAATALTNLGGASLSAANAFTGAQTISTAGSTSLELTTSSTTGASIVQVVNDLGSGFGLEVFGSAKTGTLVGLAKAGLSLLYASAPSSVFAIATVSASPIALVTNSIERMRIMSGGNVLIGTATDDGVHLLQVAGSLKCVSLDITAGSNTKTGSGTLAAGTVTIANTSVTANSKIFLTPTSSSATTSGVLAVTTITAATSFVVKSSLATDVATFSYFIVETA